MKLPHATIDDLVVKLQQFGLDQDTLVNKAILQAQKSHHAQTRDDNSSYLEQHIYPTTLLVIDYQIFMNQHISPELVAGALLHDVLEDDPNVGQDLIRNMFGDKLLQIVKPLDKTNYSYIPTKRERTEAYIKGIENAPEESRIIKLADRYNNICCVHTSDRAKVDKYIKETEEFYLPLAQKHSVFFYVRIKQRLEELKALQA